MSERLKRASSYQRLIERLKRNPSERFDPEDWPRPKTYRQVWHHALKGGASKVREREGKGNRVTDMKKTQEDSFWLME
jgi:hypothetical protein